MRKLLVVVSMFGLFGCGTQPQLAELVNDMVVLTNFNGEVDFDQYATYALPLDTVGLVSNQTSKQALSNDYAKLITSTIKKNLDLTNRTRVESKNNPDLGINVLVVNDLSVTASYNPYYNPGFGGYYGYYGYGPGYGYGYTTYNYFEQAVLIIEFVDLKNPTVGDPPVIWSANIGDLVNSFDTSAKTREAIDQAFTQSAFLKR